MKALGEPYKFGRWQVQEIIDNYGKKKIQVKLFQKTKNGGLNFNRKGFINFKDDEVILVVGSDSNHQ